MSICQNGEYVKICQWSSLYTWICIWYSNIIFRMGRQISIGPMQYISYTCTYVVSLLITVYNKCYVQLTKRSALRSTKNLTPPSSWPIRLNNCMYSGLNTCLNRSSLLPIAGISRPLVWTMHMYAHYMVSMKPRVHNISREGECLTAHTCLKRTASSTESTPPGVN